MHTDRGSLGPAPTAYDGQSLGNDNRDKQRKRWPADVGKPALIKHPGPYVRAPARLSAPMVNPIANSSGPLAHVPCSRACASHASDHFVHVQSFVVSFSTSTDQIFLPWCWIDPFTRHLSAFGQRFNQRNSLEFANPLQDPAEAYIAFKRCARAGGLSRDCPQRHHCSQG